MRSRQDTQRPQRYTSSASLKAGPVWKPVDSQAQSAPYSCVNRRIFCARISSMAGRVGQPQGWPVPVSGTSTPSRPVAFRFVEEAATVPDASQEPPK